MKKHIFTMVIAFVIAATLLLYMFTFQVRENEAAVVLTFGKADEKVREAGIHFRLPWPIQEVREFDKRLYIYNSKPEESPTKEQFNIIASVCVGWHIRDFLKYNKNFGGGAPEKGVADAQAELTRIVRDKINATIGGITLADLVSLEPEDLKHTAIEEEIKSRANKEALETYGIEVSLLKLRRLELPETVKGTVYSRMRAEREEKAQEIRSRGKERAEVITNNAKAQAQEIKSRAEARAKAIMSEGERKAATYYEAFKKYPELAVYLKEVEAFRKIAKDRTTLVLDTRSPAVRVLTAEPPEMKKSKE